MITFIITKDDVTKTIQFSTDGTLLDLKKEIIKQFDVKCDYIDIISNVEVPIRVMGKFNYDKGLQPRTLDNYPFNRYGIDGRTIPITFNEVTDYLPLIKKPSTSAGGSSSKYVPPNAQSLDVKKNIPTYDLNNDNDFPSL